MTGCLCERVRACVSTSSNPILLGCLGGRDRKLEGSKGGFFTFKERKMGGWGWGGLQREWVMCLKQGFTNSGPRVPQEMTNDYLMFALIWQNSVWWVHKCNSESYFRRSIDFISVTADPVRVDCRAVNNVVATESFRTTLSAWNPIWETLNCLAF